MGDETFVKITNQMIYDEIVSLKTHVEETNGKVKLNRWIATTSLCGVVGLTGWIFALLTKIS